MHEMLWNGQYESQKYGITMFFCSLKPHGVRSQSPALMPLVVEKGKAARKVVKKALEIA
jgi:hypothetical protein